MRLRQQYGDAAVRRRLARERGPAGPGENPNLVPLGAGAGGDANQVPIGTQVRLWGLVCGGVVLLGGVLLECGFGVLVCVGLCVYGEVVRGCGVLLSTPTLNNPSSHPCQQAKRATRSRPLHHHTPPTNPPQVSEEDALRASLPEGASVPDVEWWDKPLLVGGRYDSSAGARMRARMGLWVDGRGVEQQRLIVRACRNFSCLLKPPPPYTLTPFLNTHTHQPTAQATPPTLKPHPPTHRRQMRRPTATATATRQPRGRRRADLSAA